MSPQAPDRQNRDWTTIYVYLHRATADIDAFLLKHVWPDARAMVNDGSASTWHFLRYWTGGPHLRIRLRDADPDRVEQFTNRLRAAAAETASAGLLLNPSDYYANFGQVGAPEWNVDGTVLAADYSPETERYGGPDALLLCEDFFHSSSELALQILSSPASRAHLGVIAIDFMMIALDRLGLDDRAAVVSLRGYFAAWDFTGESVTESAVARRSADGAYWGRQAQWDARRAALADVVGSASPSTHKIWSTELTRTIVALQLIITQEAPRDSELGRIVWSLIHMTNNRLGLGVSDEQVACWLASLAFPAATREPDYFSSAPDAPDRAFVEQSKYRQLAMVHTQAPRSAVAPAGRQHGPEVALPTPGPLSASLEIALATRRSGYGDYGQALDLKTLGTLLYHALGVVAGTSLPGDGTPARRTYPSPSAAFAVDTYLVALAIDGLSAGVYRYASETHRLSLVHAGPSAGFLGRLSPFFHPDAGPGAVVDSGTVPALLLLVADIAPLRERYGLRAVRLALLEAGHMSQNIALCAAASGLTSVHINGFDDDEANQHLYLDGVDRFTVAVIPVGSPAGARVHPEKVDSYGQQD